VICTVNPSVVEVVEPKAGVFAIPRLTTWLTAVLVLVMKLESPEYTAVMLWVPTPKLVMAAEVAEPEVKVIAEPMALPLSKNWTVPVAVPAPGEVAAIVAVKVTDCPKTEGVVEANVVVVLALFTTWLTAELVLVTKLESPE